MPMPMLARCHIDGSRRRWRQRRPCQSMRRVEGSVPDDDDTDAGQVPHRGTPPMQLPMATMTIPMLARSRIEGCRRCRCRCWPGATSMEVDDAGANAGHAKACAGSRVLPLTMTIPMLARCRIEGRRRCCCRWRCWPCAASMDADDQDGTMTTLTTNMRAAVFHLATLDFPRRPVFLPSTSPPETNRLALVAGPVK